MVKYLDQIDIDVYIYITEGDKEYQNETQAELSTEKAISPHSRRPVELESITIGGYYQQMSS